MPRNIPIDLRRIGPSIMQDQQSPVTEIQIRDILAGMSKDTDALKRRHVISIAPSGLTIIVNRQSDFSSIPLIGGSAPTISTLLLQNTQTKRAYSIKNLGGPLGQSLLGNQLIQKTVLAGATFSAVHLFGTWGYQNQIHFITVTATTATPSLVVNILGHPIGGLASNFILQKDIFAGAIIAAGAFAANTGNAGAAADMLMQFDNSAGTGNITFDYYNIWGSRVPHPLNSIYIGSSSVSQFNGLELKEDQEIIVELDQNISIFGSLVPLLADAAGGFAGSSVSVKITPLQSS